ncbi:hypothetical protein JAN5088_03518 [Jannaschia rubra]|uniref:Uncharacterized protein n=1 Tax=Jannaschia rubra TaxID=282197 RepID=A0A0M6XVI7_9RHOB|nr:hypothetical protein JAN5088_03518 [Jannaschia rubra]
MKMSLSFFSLLDSFIHISDGSPSAAISSSVSEARIS